MTHQHSDVDRARVSIFEVTALADAGTPTRILGFFAQLGMVPSRVHMRRRSDELCASITQPGLSEHAAEVVGEKLRSLVVVRSVKVSTGSRT